MYSQKSTLVSSSTTQNSIYNILLPTQMTAHNSLSHDVLSKYYETSVFGKLIFFNQISCEYSKRHEVIERRSSEISVHSGWCNRKPTVSCFETKEETETNSKQKHLYRHHLSSHFTLSRHCCHIS